MERWQVSAKEIARYSVIENTIEGYLKADLAAEELHLSIRQIFRLKRKLKEEGFVGTPALLALHTHSAQWCWSAHIHNSVL